MRKVKVTISIDSELMRALSDIAAQAHISRSAAASQAIAEYVAKPTRQLSMDGCRG